MFQSRLFTTKPLMYIFVAGITVTALAGNASVLAILTRFKRLRTLPNILLANLALVDLLWAIINVFLFLSDGVSETGRFEEKTLALVTFSLQFGFVILNLASTVALMLDRFLAVYMELNYYIWKTKKKKAFLTVALIWLTCSILVLLTTLPVLGIEQAHGSCEEYQWLFFEKGKPYIASILVFFIIFAVGLGLMTVFTIRKKEKQRTLLNLCPLQAKARRRLDIHAVTTVALTVAGIIVCHMPTIVFAVFAQQNKHIGNVWFQFLAAFGPFVLSASNPIIYSPRTRRFISSLKQSFRNLSKEARFQERTPIVLERKTKSETNTKEKARDIELQSGRRQTNKNKQLVSICATDSTVFFPVWRLLEVVNEVQARPAFCKSMYVVTVSKDMRKSVQGRTAKKIFREIRMIGQAV